MKTIKYIAIYDTIENKENRNYYPSACTKIDYIIEVLNIADYGVDIISASNTKDKRSYKSKKIIINNKTQLFLLHAFARGNYIKNKISTLLFLIQLFIYLFIKLKKKDIVIVYHSNMYLNIVRFLKKIKRFKLIIEVEEIYGYISGKKKIIKKELKYFKIADSYIFSTELLESKINIRKKPYVILYGTYKVEVKRDCRFNDDKIHIVYAGTFYHGKGASSAVAASKYLDSNYHVHVIGFGNEKDTATLQNQILDISKYCMCTVTFDGLKIGEEYINFIQKCGIGLSTQPPNSLYNDTSFPSKILSYMSNGLQVVSISIPVIKISAIGKYINYYDEYTPKALAEAIKSVNLTGEYDSRRVINLLHEQFIEELSLLLSSTINQ